MINIQECYPSIDGNKPQRDEFINQISHLLTRIDTMKDSSKLTLGRMPEYTDSFYTNKIHEAQVPDKGTSLEGVVDKLLELVEGHRMVNSFYLANATPLPNNASIIGNMLMTLLNGNNLWDVDGSASAQAEVKITSALSKVVGYDETQSGGYTTWGGQGAVFNSLRLAISRMYPNANKEGVPRNLYVYCSEDAHFSLYKAVEATGIGTNNLIRIKTNDTGEMDINHLKEEIDKTINNGGVPVYVLATMGSTDSFAIDDITTIKEILEGVEKEYKLKSIYLHADSAMGCMYTFFNDYNFSENKLGLEEEILHVLQKYRSKLKAISLADSMVFDFHKLGQTPYITSLFLVKNKHDFKYVDLNPDETPYVGNRGYGSYHTSYTLECSRMGSSIPILASLEYLGLEGYQLILANYLRVNIAFRKALTENFSDVEITNVISPVTTFRFYKDKNNSWRRERSKNASKIEIVDTNKYNESLAEEFGVNRAEVYFGSTKKQCNVQPKDTLKQIPLYVHKFYSVSPYTTVDQIDRYIEFLKKYKNKVDKRSKLIEV